jgi:hypothetical protein
MPVNISEATLEAVVVVGEAFVVEAKDIEDGGVEIIDRGDIVDCLVAKFVRGSVAETLRDFCSVDAGYLAGKRELSRAQV